jgi:predicted metal-dependent enzyme (double-stranded beta helix superfamily)
MTHRSTIQRVGFALVIALTASTAPMAGGQTISPDANGFITAQPEDLIPPEGSRAVRILGDPSQPGNYVLRITFAPGTGTRPHFHNQDRYITVLEGTWWVAGGPDAATHNPEAMRPIKASSFLYQPANGIHYDQARAEAVTVQISGVGPMKTTRVESDQ